jgi:hypothetical protein
VRSTDAGFELPGVFDLRDVWDGPYDLLDARKLNYKFMTEDFFATLGNAAVYHLGQWKRLVSMKKSEEP